jgi:hypothetical protein
MMLLSLSPPVLQEPLIRIQIMPQQIIVAVLSNDLEIVGFRFLGILAGSQPPVQDLPNLDLGALAKKAPG